MPIAEALHSGDPLGRLVLRGDPALWELVRGDVSVACLKRESRRGAVDLEGVRARYKLGGLRGKSRLRHGLRRVLSGRPAPRLAEFDNLAWLRRNGFGAPRPLLAGAFHRAGFPHFQFLYTEEVPGARDLRAALAGADPSARRRLLDELARDVARFHAGGFVHRDLFPRNVLVTGAAEAPAIVFLDAWRGGPRPGLRGPSYDLACFFLFGAALLDATEQHLFLATWIAERERLARRLPTFSRRLLLRRVGLQRRALLRRHRRARRTRSGGPGPEGGLEPPHVWSPPDVAGSARGA